MLNALLQKYTATTKFNVAEWTTASFFKIGQSFEVFGESVMESQAPAGASEDELKIYWETVRTKLVLPLLAKAVEYYQSNLKLASEASIQNDWVEQSRARLEILQEELASASAPTADNSVPN